MGLFSSVTVVTHYSVFWEKLPGPIIYQHGVSPRPPQSVTTPPPIQTTTPSTLPEPVSVGPLNYNVKQTSVIHEN